jgi:hypothetical protein
MPVQKGEAFEQLHVLLVFEQRAVERQDQLFRVAGESGTVGTFEKSFTRLTL